MRVISGIYKGKKLIPPQGDEIRPTLDRVKEAVFDVIQFRILRAAALDLFSGTGAMGIEAASRGADVIFNDVSPDSCELIRQNCLKAGFTPRIYTLDYLALIDVFASQGKKFDIIFIDPPYGGETGVNAVLSVFEKDIIADGGVAVFEHGFNGQNYLEKLQGISFKSKKYGKVYVDFIYKT